MVEVLEFSSYGKRSQESPNPAIMIACSRKTYLFKKLYTETIIRNPKKVGLFGYR